MSATATIVINNQGIIKYAGESLLTRSGFALAQVIDKSPKQLWGGHMSRRIYDRLWNDLSRGKPHIVALKNKTRSGDWYTSHFHMIPVFNQKGAEPYYVGVDVSLKGGNIEEKKFLKVWNDGNNYQQSAWWSESFGVQTRIDSLYKWIDNTWVAPVRETFLTRYTDAQLIEQAQKDNRLFGTLYAKYRTDVYRYILSRVYGKTSLAEDLTQETFLKAFQYLSTYTSGYATYKTYLYTIAYSRIVDSIRREKNFSTQSFDILPESFLMNTDDKQIDFSFLLEQAKKFLTSAEYQVIESFYVYQDSIREISIGMARSQNAVKLLLSRARKKLAQRLPER